MTTGEPGMSAHELSVIWPAYYAYVDRRRKREQEKADAKRRHRPLAG